MESSVSVEVPRQRNQTQKGKSANFSNLFNLKFIFLFYGLIAYMSMCLCLIANMNERYA